MNNTFKSIITNPVTIGGGLTGLGLTVAAIVHACTRAKTPEELALEKAKEDHREEERKRQYELEIERVKASAAKHEIDVKAEAERKEAERKEAARKDKDWWERQQAIREWEKSAPAGYWELKIAEANGKRQKEAADREADTQREIARLQAEATKAAAEANANAVKSREYYGYLNKKSQNEAQANMMQGFVDGIANVARGGGN